MATLIWMTMLAAFAQGEPAPTAEADQAAATEAAAAWSQCLESQVLGGIGGDAGASELADAALRLCEPERRAMAEAHERWIASSGVDAGEAAEAREQFDESLAEAREELAEAIREYRENMAED